MNIKIICVGKLKEQYLKAAVAEYSKRLSRFCRLEIVEVADEKTPEQASAATGDRIKAIEGERILKKVADRTILIALDLAGAMASSEEMAERLATYACAGHSSLTFVIGGSLGLAPAVLARADYRLCFSRMTFPHQLMRVILLEQLYRWFKIKAGEPYHK